MGTPQTAESAGAQRPARRQEPAAAKVPALILTLGGAPESWHVIPGVGHVHPTIPSPIGGEREPSLTVAKKLAANPGCDVSLVEVTVEEAEAGRAARAVARGEGLRAARDVRRLDRQALPAEREQVRAEAGAVRGEGA